MSAGGTGQAVCLHLIITVPYSPAGGHAALIVDEMSRIHVLAHMDMHRQTHTMQYTGNPGHAFNSLSPVCSMF